MSQEEVVYKTLDDFPGYRFGSDGSVWGNQRTGPGTATRPWRKLIGGVDKEGYARHVFCCNGKRVFRRRCQLIAEAFLGTKPAGCEVCHNNGDPKDDRASNLRWDTHRNNILDKKAHGTHQIGEKNGSCKIPWSEVLEIRKMHANGMTNKEIAAAHSLSTSYVYALTSKRKRVACKR